MPDKRLIVAERKVVVVVINYVCLFAAVLAAAVGQAPPSPLSKVVCLAALAVTALSALVMASIYNRNLYWLVGMIAAIGSIAAVS